MSDIVDLAVTIEAETIAASLAAIVSDIPKGVAGECEECGEQMPRLVDGRCGFCRDGRMPPASFYADRDQIVAPVSPRRETEAMPAQSNLTMRKINFSGDALSFIEGRAEDSDITFTQAASELVELGAASSFTLAPKNEAMIDPVEVAIYNLPDVALIDELRRRLLAYSISPDDLNAAIERAETAEARVAAMRSVLG